MAETTPEVTWAQRSSADDPTKNIIYLTLNTPDVSDKSATIDLTSTGLKFKGKSDTRKATFIVDLEFYAEIDTAESTTHHSARGVDFVLRKKEAKAEYWPRLLKSSQRMHFLKTDFDKWVDEDEQDEVVDDAPTGYGGGMPMGGDDEGGFGGLDFSKLGGAGGEGGMPDLSALQGMAGMGGMGGMGAGGMGGMGGMGGEEEDDDDADDDDDEEDMPDLEGEAPVADKGKGKAAETEAPAAAKIQEID
ncbi:hypothetical protein MMC25_003500 [Agyrium rufum]|nr:hypothetical protein [Agyrium rufum]